MSKKPEKSSKKITPPLRPTSPKPGKSSPPRTTRDINPSRRGGGYETR